jgi:hypothetical protein
MKAVGIAALAMVFAAGTSYAGDISAKKMLVKGNADPAKKQLQVQSSDASVTFTDAVDPDVEGAAIHVYSATDELCYVIPGGADWTEKVGKSWKYKNKLTKNQIQIQDGKLQVKLRSGVALTPSNPEGTYNVQVQLGDLGEKFCMKCTGASVTKDDDKKFQGKDCVAAVCDAEPPGCDTNVTTTTSTTTTSTTLPALPGTILKAVLSQTSGLFTYAMTSGVPGADTACNTAFAGSHACTYSELQAAEAAGDLDNIKDVDDDVVTSFWAIDPLRPEGVQCVENLGGGGMRWFYRTAHIDSSGDFVTLTNASGDLGSLQTGNRNCGNNRWVGCCQ